MESSAPDAGAGETVRGRRTSTGANVGSVSKRVRLSVLFVMLRGSDSASLLWAIALAVMNKLMMTTNSRGNNIRVFKGNLILLFSFYFYYQQ